MQKILICLALFFSLTLFAEYSFDVLEPYPRAEVSYDFGGGFRSDCLKWNIAGSRSGPDILSELTWRDLHMAEVFGQINIGVGCIYLKAKGDYANIFHGKNQDSDYLESHRQREYSRSYAKTDGSAFDILGGAGIRFPFFCEHLYIIPVGGYADSELDLCDKQGYQAVDLFDEDNLGSFPGLHSKYKAKWFGPWAGVDAEWRFYQQSIRLLGSFEYHWATYKGNGHWNLRRDFAGNIHHSANGYGLVGLLGLQNEFWCGWTMSLYGNYNYWHADRGRHSIRVYASDLNSYSSSETVKLGTRLNEVTWQSYSVLLTVGYNF